MTDMTKKEILDSLKQMEEQGEMEPCLVAVPFFECGVSAGIPKEPGDYDGEVMMVPKSWLKDGPIAQVQVNGDSMKDAGIDEDDVVTMLWGQNYDDGDVVVASLDGEDVVKAFFRDKDGHAWLVPANCNYSPIDVEAYSNAYVLGKVVRVTKPLKRMSYKYMQERIDAALIAAENPVDTSVLESPDALICWAALREAGVVDERNRAKDGVWMDALIADVMGDYLGIRNKWKVFCAYHGKKYEGGNNALSDSLNKKKNQREVKKMKKFLEGIICYKQ